ncbi:MAG TPA: hypothetical protein VFU71_18800 [Burkholderiaceae bacterium]|nr:hypothetical protein [Burkholderiaceae bacterium]
MALIGSVEPFDEPLRQTGIDLEHKAAGRQHGGRQQAIATRRQTLRSGWSPAGARVDLVHRPEHGCDIDRRIGQQHRIAARQQVPTAAIDNPMHDDLLASHERNDVSDPVRRVPESDANPRSARN